MTPYSLQRGYTLLFAVLIASLLLGVAVFILSSSRKQFILSSTARESMYSIYAADSGIECAAYGYKNGLFATDTVGNPNPKFSCNGATSDITFTTPPADNSNPNSKYYGLNFSGSVYQAAPINVSFPTLPSGQPDSGCAVIDLYQGRTTDGFLEEVADSRGYNVGNAGTCPQYTPRTAERLIRLILE